MFTNTKLWWILYSFLPSFLFWIWSSFLISWISIACHRGWIHHSLHLLFFFFLIFIEPNPLLLTRDLIFFCFKYRFFFSFQNEGGVGRPNGETAAHPRLDFGAHGPAGRRPAGLQPPKVHARFGPTLGKKKKPKTNKKQKNYNTHCNPRGLQQVIVGYSRL